MTDPRLARLGAMCDDLPEAEWEPRRQHARFSVRKRTFAYFLVDHRGNEGITGLACKVAQGEAQMLIDGDPERYYRPAYLGASGWVGVRLDTGDVDWEEVEGLLSDAYLLTAPKRLAAAAMEQAASQMRKGSSGSRFARRAPGKLSP